MNSELLIDPKLDLVLERTLDIKPELAWKGWTNPEALMQWFCPLPWKTIACEIDLQPGGKFKTIMQSPEGQEFPNAGTFLQIIENKKLVWTSALLPGFRPVVSGENGADNLLFTGIILLEPAENGTKYTAIAMHKDEADCQKHEKMGFHEGWGICADQLVTAAKKNFQV